MGLIRVVRRKYRKEIELLQEYDPDKARRLIEQHDAWCCHMARSLGLLPYDQTRTYREMLEQGETGEEE